MNEITKSELDQIIKGSELPPTEITNLLEEVHYNTKSDWITLLQRLFLGLGSGLMCAGIIFFFAFNWDDIHKFVKLGIVGVLLLGCILPVLFMKLKPLYSNILLTASSVMVGVAFAVYGQIYQTGADAYDFFLAWTSFVAIWAFSTRFSPMWVVFLSLTTLTTMLYVDQEIIKYSEDLILLILILKFAVVYFIIRGIEYLKETPIFDRWFDNLLQLVLVYLITVAINLSLFQDFQTSYILSIGAIALVFYPFLFMRGLKQKNIVSVSIIPFSIMFMICAALLKASDEIPMVTFLVILSSAFMVVFVNRLLHLLKLWKNENA